MIVHYAVKAGRYRFVSLLGRCRFVSLLNYYVTSLTGTEPDSVTSLTDTEPHSITSGLPSPPVSPRGPRPEPRRKRQSNPSAGPDDG